MGLNHYNEVLDYVHLLQTMSLRSEDHVSVLSASSSGIPDCDLTVLGDEENSKLISKVEQELKKLNYTIASIVPAGREVYKNIASRIQHSEMTVILITKLNSRRFQNFLQYIPLGAEGGGLDNTATLLLVEDKIKLQKRYKNFIRLLLPKTVELITNRINGFIRALRMPKEYTEFTYNNFDEFRKFYGSLLLHSILNPLKNERPLQSTLNDIQIKFSTCYGSFDNIVSSSLENHLLKSSEFTVENDKVSQTEKGAFSAFLWWNNTFSPPERDSDQASRESEPVVPSLVGTSSTAEDWILSNEKSKETDIDWKEIEPLENLLREFDSRYSFFLVSGKNTPSDKVNGISKIPWIKVIDFDVNSRITGLLSSVETKWKNNRSFSISTIISNSPKPLSYDHTDWFFPLGFTDQQESLCEGQYYYWFSEHKVFLEELFSSIANFCILRTKPVFLILWYDQKRSNVNYLDWLLSVLLPAFKTNVSHPVKVVLCTSKRTDGGDLLENVVSKYNLTQTTLFIEAVSVYKWLSTKVIPERPQPETIRLPAENEGIAEINNKQLSIWIGKNIELLSLESQDQILQRKTDDFGKEFVKGGLISWDELASNKVAVERNAKTDVNEFLLKEVLSRQKSIVLRLLHAPGGGGTTFSRQILWSLHNKVPCGVVIPNLSLSIAEISEKVKYIYDITHLPVVLLIDGCSEFEVNQLYENCKYAIVILHVQRCSQNIPENNFSEASRTCRLPGKVTLEEAKNLTKVFSSFSPPRSHDALKALTRDVKDKKEKFVFEYGLAAFHHEFKGVKKYVQGYLNTSDQRRGIKYWKSWQKVVAYLSLALYYGQSGLHRETFHSILKEKQKETFVSLEDLDYSGRQFIIETKQEWKINYHIVAAEILEQLLSGPNEPTETRCAGLGDVASTNLHLLVIEFIQMIKKSCKGSKPEFILQLLSNIIIRRDYKEVDKSDGLRKRCLLSRLLEDIPEKENRILILQNLRDCFPQHAEFHAHLGRLLNLMDRFEEAERSLKIALKIRTAECDALRLNSTDDMMCRILNMFGFGYSRNAKLELKKSIKNPSLDAYTKMLDLVNKAIYHFSKARRFATHNLSYRYIGEVRSRLLVVQYVHETFSDGCRKAFENKLGSSHLLLSEFVRDSHSICDQLLAECVHYTSQQELEHIYDYKQSVQNYITYFKHINKNLPLWNETISSLPMRRSHIASLKLFHKIRYGASIGNLTSIEDLQLMIQLHEQTFREVFKKKLLNVSITVDVLDWLEAIRHPCSKQKVSLFEVLDIVEKGENRNESNYGTFYLYVINFLLALFNPGRKLGKEYYSKASVLKEKLHSQRQQCELRVWRLEWIACDEELTTIKTIIHEKNLGTWDKDKRFWKDEKHIRKLKVFTGTVVLSNHPLKGSISLDVTQSHYKCRMDVYFVPKLYDLYKSIYAEQKLRVEFCIGFSFQHGAEAFNIRKVEKVFCNCCNAETERITINADGKCRTCHS